MDNASIRTAMRFTTLLKMQGQRSSTPYWAHVQMLQGVLEAPQSGQVNVHIETVLFVVPPTARNYFRHARVPHCAHFQKAKGDDEDEDYLLLTLGFLLVFIIYNCPELFTSVVICFFVPLTFQRH